MWLAAVRSGGKVWETCCAACCRLARSGKGYAAGCWLREGAVHRNSQRCCRVFEVWHGAVLCRLLSRAVARSGKGAVQGAVQAAGQSAVARGTVQGCWVQGAVQCWTVRWRTLGKGLLCRLLPRVRWRGLAKVLCRLLSRVRWEALSAGCCAGCCPQCEATALQRIMFGTKFDCALQSFLKLQR